MRFVMSGGGTAGHVYPASTVAEELLAAGHEVLFVGAPGGLESRLVPEAGIPFRTLPAGGFDRSRPLTLLSSSAVLVGSALRATALLRGFGPDAVIGFGGYVSIPVGLAAAISRTPLVLHEQNSVPGLANRLLSRFATAAAVTYPGSVARLAHPERAVLTGNPVRRAVLRSTRGAARESLGFGNEELVLLVFGGSRGARHINQALMDLYDRLMDTPGLRVLHVAGRIEAASMRERLADLGGDGDRYRVTDYIDDMGAAIAAADLVVSRAGATSIAELTALGRPAVLIPYPYATDDHQTSNALAVQEAGGAEVVADAELDGERFAEALFGLLKDPVRREAMAGAARRLGRPEAARSVARVAVEAGSGRRQKDEEAEGTEKE